MKIVRNKFFIMLVVGALALGLVGGAVLAATTPRAPGSFNGDSDGYDKGFAARVAEKLNRALGLEPEQQITETQMQDAFNSAAGDQQEELLQARLDALEVEEAAAAAIMDWFKEYPATDFPRLRYIGLADSERVKSALEHLVDKERITQAQADGIQSWYADRPDLPEGLEKSGRHGWGGKRGFRDGDGRGHHRDGDGDRKGHHRDGNEEGDSHHKGGDGSDDDPDPDDDQS